MSLATWELNPALPGVPSTEKTCADVRQRLGEASRYPDDIVRRDVHPRFVPMIGDSMPPTINPGDLVAVMPSTRWHCDDRYVICETDTPLIVRASSDLRRGKGGLRYPVVSLALVHRGGFRALKRDGMALDETQLHGAERLFELAVVALIAATRTIQLVDARHGGRRPTTDVIDAELLPVARALGLTLERNTARQKNPHPENSLAWPAWIIARLGGWNCYYKPTEPKTMHAGWAQFATMATGFTIATTFAQKHKKNVRSRSHPRNGRTAQRLYSAVRGMMW